MRCTACNGIGTCQPCRGSGRSGNSPFWQSDSHLNPCRRCAGSGKCASCGGTGQVDKAVNEFHPEIVVRTSQSRPQPIFAVAMKGGRWRFIAVPSDFKQRSDQEQLAWVKKTCRSHYIQSKGECLCFGSIIGYEWRKAENESVLLDTDGQIIATGKDPSTPGTASLTVGNKTVEVRRDGSFKIDAGGRE
jgi:hypothetical protein